MSNWGAISTGIAGQALTLNRGTASFADANAATGKTVTATGYSLANGTGLANNYQLASTSATTTADISKADLTVSGLAASNKVYDASTAAAMTGAAAVSALGSDVVRLSGTAAGTFADANVGTGKAVAVIGITLDSASANNYNLIQQAGLTADIAAARDIAAAGDSGLGADAPVQQAAIATAQAATSSLLGSGTNSSALGAKDLLAMSNPSGFTGPSGAAAGAAGGSGSSAGASSRGISLSGGLAFVDVPGESGGSSANTGSTGGSSGSPQGSTSNDGAGRDISGFMRVFVVGGGINLEGR